MLIWARVRHSLLATQYVECAVFEEEDKTLETRKPQILYCGIQVSAAIISSDHILCFRRAVWLRIATAPSRLTLCALLRAATGVGLRPLQTQRNGAAADTPIGLCLPIHGAATAGVLIWGRHIVAAVQQICLRLGTKCLTSTCNIQTRRACDTSSVQARIAYAHKSCRMCTEGHTTELGETRPFSKIVPAAC